ncbi:MAG: hypothetical protein KC505_01115 [Myxococcales bacterium]|nr:hypothetical protein [Myxococcales bacterium]USN50836.1 MAG: hypothetical protein H6731_11395 [Myxococcales bacterium]
MKKIAVLMGLLFISSCNKSNRHREVPVNSEEKEYSMVKDNKPSIAVKEEKSLSLIASPVVTDYPAVATEPVFPPVLPGPPGLPGSDGNDGGDGFSSLTRITTEESGGNCESGGQKIEVGIDRNRNSLLEESEIDETSYVCNGANAEPIIDSPFDFTYSVFINDTIHNIADDVFSMRAITQMGDRFYTCFILTGNNKPVLSYDLSGAFVDSYIYSATNTTRYCKSMAAHPLSNKVYAALGDSDELMVINGDLSSPVYIELDTLVGISDTGNNDFDAQGVTISGNTMFISSDQLGRVYKFNLDSNGNVTWDNTWNSGTGYVSVGNSASELAQLGVDASGYIFVAAEEDNQVYRISPDGAIVDTPLTIPVGAKPQDVDFYDNYILVSFQSSSGNGAYPHGIGVFLNTTFQQTTTLVDSLNEMRNINGIVVYNNDIYAVDGFYGSPNDFSQPVDVTSPDVNQTDLIVKLEPHII